MASTSAPSTPAKQPSYARPTVASESHKTVNETHSNGPNPSAANTPSRREVFRSYNLSTVSSRSKTRRPGPLRFSNPFRFFSLPPEIRNRIYEHAGMERAACSVDLHQPKIKSLLGRLPHLLQVNKQMCDEAGSYYFSSGTFDILVDRSRLHVFMDWLRIIGQTNRESLANNKHVTVKLTLNVDNIHDGQRALTESSRGSGDISFVDAAHVTGLFRELKSLNGRYTGLDKWTFKSQHMSGQDYRNYHRSSLYWWDKRHFYDVHCTDKFFAKLRTAIKGILALLEGQKVDLKEDRNGVCFRPEGWIPEGGVGCYRMTAPFLSGRPLIVYTQT